MAHPLESAYEMYVEKLNKLILEEVKIKKMLNEFAREMEIQIPFPDITEGIIKTAPTVIKNDDFVGKSPSTAIGEYLERIGSAVIWEEIVGALTAGGFEWNSYGGIKGARSSIVKNTYTFKYIKQTNAFGLKKWYPDERKNDKKEKKNLADALIKKNPEEKEESENGQTDE